MQLQHSFRALRNSLKVVQRHPHTILDMLVVVQGGRREVVELHDSPPIVSYFQYPTFAGDDNQHIAIQQVLVRAHGTGVKGSLSMKQII